MSRKQRKVSMGKFALGANGKLVRLKKDSRLLPQLRISSVSKKYSWIVLQ